MTNVGGVVRVSFVIRIFSSWVMQLPVFAHTTHMPSDKKKPDKKTKELPVKLVADNRKARFNYEILDSLECLPIQTV